jgi:hypothetical protein
MDFASREVSSDTRQLLLSDSVMYVLMYLLTRCLFAE